MDNNVVDPAAGDLYVASYYEEGGVHEPVVDVFKPEAGGGEPVSPANVKQLTGTCGHIGEVAAGAGVCAVIRSAGQIGWRSMNPMVCCSSPMGLLWMCLRRVGVW